MPNVVIVGAQWGDEGKAKITDLLAEDADVVVRCQGGCNAGHTVHYNGQVFKFHLVPSGLLYNEKLCVVGPGTVIDPRVLLKEIATLQERGYSTGNLKVSNRAHLTLPIHVTLDQAQETSLAQNKIGTTGRGIGPTYIDKVGRVGIRLGDLLEDETTLRDRLMGLAVSKGPWLREKEPGKTMEAWVEEWLDYCKEYTPQLKPYIEDTVSLLHQQVSQDKNILFEGAQGTLLDVDYGTYPYVTSSNASAGGACTGSGIGPTAIDQVIGVMKAYTTRVGEGPFPTELNDEVGNHLVEVGQEFGTTTGRKRRCGWFDAVVGRYSAQINGLDGLAITKLDVFDGLPELKIGVAYRHTETGEIFQTFPSQLSVLKKLEPVYETFPGWSGSVQGAQKWEDLPIEARQYLGRLSELLEVPIVIVSIGPDRYQTLFTEDTLWCKNRTYAF